MVRGETRRIPSVFGRPVMDEPTFEFQKLEVYQRALELKPLIARRR